MTESDSPFGGRHEPPPTAPQGPLAEPERFRAEELTGPVARSVYRSDQADRGRARGGASGGGADLDAEVRQAHNRAMEQAYREMGRPFYREEGTHKIRPVQPDAQWFDERRDKAKGQRRKRRDEELDAQLKTLDFEASDPARQVMRDADRRRLEESAREARDKMLAAAEDRLVSDPEWGRSRGLFRGPTDQAQALAAEQERLQAIRLGEADLTDEDLAAMADADPEAAAAFEEARATIAQDEENRAWRAKWTERRRRVEAERIRPEAFAMLEAEHIANATPEELAAEADELERDVVALGESITAREEQLLALQADHEARILAASQAEQERLRAGVTADQLVDVEGVGRMTVQGHADMAALQAHEARMLATVAEASAELEADWEDYQAVANRLHERHKYLAKLATEERERNAAEMAERVAQLRATPGLEPLADEIEAVGADIEREMERIAALPREQQEAALSALQERSDERIAAKQRELREALREAEAKAREEAQVRGERIEGAWSAWSAMIDQERGLMTAAGPGAAPYEAVRPDAQARADARRQAVYQLLAEQYDMPVAEAKTLVDDARGMMDWSASSGLDSEARILSTGEVVVRPDLYFQPEQARKQLARVGATPEQIQQFEDTLDERQEQVTEAFIRVMDTPVFRDPLSNSTLPKRLERNRAQGVDDTETLRQYFSERGAWRTLNDNLTLAIGRGVAQVAGAVVGLSAATYKGLDNLFDWDFAKRQIEQLSFAGAPMEAWQQAAQFVPQGGFVGRFVMDTTSGVVSLVPSVLGGGLGHALRPFSLAAHTRIVRALPAMTRRSEAFGRAMSAATTPEAKRRVVAQFYGMSQSAMGGVMAGAFAQSYGMAFTERFHHNLEQGMDAQTAASIARSQAYVPGIGTAVTVLLTGPLKGAQSILRPGGVKASAGEMMRRIRRDDLNRALRDPQFREVVRQVGRDLGREMLWEAVQEGMDEFQQSVWRKLHGVDPDMTWVDALGNAVYGALIGAALGGAVPAAGAVRPAHRGAEKGRSERPQWERVRGDIGRIADPVERSRAEALWYVAQGELDLLSPEQMSLLGIEQVDIDRDAARQGDRGHRAAPQPEPEPVSMGFRRAPGHNANQGMLAFGDNGQVSLSLQGAIELAAVSPEASRVIDSTISGDQRSMLRFGRVHHAARQVEAWQPAPDLEMDDAAAEQVRLQARAVLHAATESLPMASDEVLASVGLQRADDGTLSAKGESKGVSLHLGEPVVADSLAAALRDHGLGAVANLVPAMEADRRQAIEAEQTAELERRRQAEEAAIEAAERARASEGEWTATGERGTKVTLPAAEASTKEQAMAKMAGRLPEGERLEPDSVQPPRPAAPAEPAPGEATPPGHAAVNAAVDRLFQSMPRLREHVDVFATMRQAPANMSESGADAHNDRIRIVVDVLANQAAHLPEAERATYLDGVISEEVKHLSEERAARALWKISKDPRSFEDWAADYYQQLWNEGFSAEQRQWIEDTYGGLLADTRGEARRFPDAQVMAREGLRMILQARADGRITESSTLTLLSEALAKHLRAVIAAIKSLASGGSLTPDLRLHVEQAEQVLRTWRTRGGQQTRDSEGKVVGPPVAIERQGPPVSLVTPDQDGALALRLDGDVAALDAGQIVGSADARYPDPRIQPRDRTSKQSAEQAAKMAANLERNPDQWRRYYEGPTTDTGKIIVAPLYQDGQPATNEAGQPLYYVVSGNGRYNAIVNAYDTGRSANYDAGIRGALEGDGIDTAGLRRPVAVVVWQPASLDAAIQMAEASNRTGQLSKTSVETATRDAAAIEREGLLALWSPSEAGDVAAASNRPFWDAFSRAIGEAGLIQSDGRPSEQAVIRAENALLAMILGDGPSARATLKKVLERADSLGIRRQVAGIVSEAGALLSLRDSAPEYDVAPVLAEALETVVRFKEARQAGQVASVEEFFAQGDMFQSGDAAANALARAIVETPTTSGIRAMLAEYRRHALAVDSTTGDMFGAAPPSRADIIGRALDSRPLDAVLDDFRQEFGADHPIVEAFQPALALWSQFSPTSRRQIGQALQYEADRLRAGVPTALEFQRGMAGLLDPEAAAVQRFVDSIDGTEAAARWRKVYTAAGRGRDVGAFLRKHLEVEAAKQAADPEAAATLKLSPGDAATVLRRRENVAKQAEVILARLPQAFRDAVEADAANGYPGVPGVFPTKGLTRYERIHEAAFVAQIAADPAKALADYIALAEDDFGHEGRYVNADLGRDLYLPYRNNEAMRNALERATIAPAGYVALNLAWNHWLRNTNPDQRSTVVFMAGGMASGKTTAVHSAFIEAEKDAAAVFVDSVLGNYDRALQLIAETEAAGFTPYMVFVYRPFDVAARGALNRLVDTGRPVRLEQLGPAHYDAQRTFLRLHDALGERLQFDTIISEGGIEDIRRTIGVDELRARAYHQGDDGDRKTGGQTAQAREAPRETDRLRWDDPRRADSGDRDGQVRVEGQARGQAAQGPLSRLAGTEQQRKAVLTNIYRDLIARHPLTPWQQTAVVHGYIPADLARPDPVAVSTLALTGQADLFTETPIEPGPIFGRHEKRKAKLLERLKYAQAMARQEGIDPKKRATMTRAAKRLAEQLDGNQGLLFDPADTAGSRDPDVDRFLKRLTDWQAQPRITARPRKGKDTATPQLPGMAAAPEAAQQRQPEPQGQQQQGDPESFLDTDAGRRVSRLMQEGGVETLPEAERFGAPDVRRFGGESRREVLPAIRAMADFSYQAIGGHPFSNSPVEAMLEPDTVFDVLFHEGKPVAFTIIKPTKEGFKSTLLGTDGTEAGRRAWKNYFNSHRSPGYYVEASGAVEAIAIKTRVPAVPAADAGRVLNKDVEPDEDGFHYHRTIQIGGLPARHRKVIFGLPWSLRNTEKPTSLPTPSTSTTASLTPQRIAASSPSSEPSLSSRSESTDAPPTLPPSARASTEQSDSGVDPAPEQDAGAGAAVSSPDADAAGQATPETAAAPAVVDQIPPDGERQPELSRTDAPQAEAAPQPAPSAIPEAAAAPEPAPPQGTPAATLDLTYVGDRATVGREDDSGRVGRDGTADDTAGPNRIARDAGADPQRQAEAVLRELPAGQEAHRVAQERSLAEGDEHVVWRRPGSDRIIKATKGGTFGSGRDASPAGYLERLARQNAEFGDDIRFLGAARGPDGTVVFFTDQPFYEGPEPTNAEVEQWFARRGYVRTGESQFYNGRLVVEDAHPRNVTKRGDADLMPFDVIVHEPSAREEDRLDTMFEAARRDPLSAYSRAREGGTPAATLQLPAPFYSKLLRQVEARLPDNATAEAATGFVRKNAKPEEVKWSGVVQAIERIAKENNGKVPKAALLDYLRNDGAVQLTEVEFDDPSTAASDLMPMDEFLAPRGMTEAEVEALPKAERLAIGKEYRQWVLDNRELLEQRRQALRGRQAQYPDKVLPDGENYRELVLAMPGESGVPLKPGLEIRERDGRWNLWDKRAKDWVFHEWAPTRQDVEELAAQDVMLAAPDAGGYRSGHFPGVANYIAHARANERVDADGERGVMAETLQSDRHQQASKVGYKGEGVRDSGIADAPFRKDWHVQLFKRLLRGAVARDLAWVGWTDGATQVERWSLENRPAEATAMRRFYNQVIPQDVQKYVKQWGAKVERVRLPVGDDTVAAWRVRITPEMRRSVASEGQPLFSMPAGENAGQPVAEAVDSPYHVFGSFERVAPASLSPSAVSALRDADRAAGFPPGSSYSVQPRVENEAAVKGENLSRAINKVFRKNILFISNDSGKAFPFEGFTSPQNLNTLVLDAETRSGITYLLGHELGHSIEHQNPRLYQQLKSTLLDMAKDWRDYDARLARVSAYDTQAKRESEFVNDFIGSQMGEPAFWRMLRDRDSGVFNRLVDAALEFLAGLGKRIGVLDRDVRPYFDNIEAARAALVETLEAYRRGEMPDASQVRDALTEGGDALLSVSATRRRHGPWGLPLQRLREPVRPAAVPVDMGAIEVEHDTLAATGRSRTVYADIGRQWAARIRRDGAGARLVQGRGLDVGDSVVYAGSPYQVAAVRHEPGSRKLGLTLRRLDDSMRPQPSQQVEIAATEPGRPFVRLAKAGEDAGAAVVADRIANAQRLVDGGGVPAATLPLVPQVDRARALAILKGNHDPTPDDHAAARAIERAFRQDQALIQELGGHGPQARPVTRVLGAPWRIGAAIVAQLSGGRLAVYRAQGEVAAPGGFLPAQIHGVVGVEAGQSAPHLVVGHELWHWIKRDHPHTSAMAGALIEQAVPRALMENAVRPYVRGYGEEQAHHEVAANIFGSAVVSPFFWERGRHASPEIAAALRKQDPSAYPEAALVPDWPALVRSLADVLGGASDGQPAATLDIAGILGTRQPQTDAAPSAPDPAPATPSDPSAPLYDALDRRANERPAARGAEQRARDRQARADRASDRAGLPRKRVTGRPDLSGVVVERDDQAVRDEFDFIDEQRRAMQDQESVQLWIKEGHKLVNDDAAGVERRLLRSALNADDVSIRAEDVMAARILVERRTREALATGDRDALRKAGMLRYAYRETRADTARALAAGRDLFRTPAERHRGYLSDALLRIPPKIVREIDRRFPFPKDGTAAQQRAAVEGKRAAVDQAIRDRLAKIEGELQKMGVTLEEIFAGEAYLRLRAAPILQGAVKPFTPAEQMAIRLIQDAAPIKKIARITELTHEQIENVRNRLRAKLKEKLRAKVAAGATLESIDLDGAAAMTLGLAPASTANLSAQDIEAELNRILDVGFGLGENHKTNVTTFRTRKRKPRRAKADAAGDLAHDVPWARPGFDQNMSWRFDIRDRAHVMQLARAIIAMDGDWIDSMAEWYYNAILSGPHTQAVNIAGTAIYGMWNATVGRGMEALLNTVLRSKEAATFGEYRHTFRALIPHLKRAASNAYAAFMTETPFFEEDILNREMDVAHWGQEDRGIYRVGYIKGTKGRWIRLATRGLLAMDEFFKTWVAGVEVGGMAYRLGLKHGYAPGSTQMQQFIRQQLNLPGSAAWQLAAKKAYEAAFTTKLPTEASETHSIGDLIALGAGTLTSYLTPKSADSGLVRLVKTLVKIFFFPFQRTPFNIIRTGGRHVPNPITGIDLGFNVAKHLRMENGKFVWKGGDADQALAVEMAAKQLQGLVFLAFLMGIGEGDDDDLEKWLIVTGSKPRSQTRRGEREMANRMGLGPYSISVRLPGGGRGTASYQRFDPIATVFGTLVDATQEVKHVLRGRRQPGEATGAFIGSLVDQMSDKTFLQGFGEFISMTRGERNMSQWTAGRIASFVPNIFKQPLRQTDDHFRERTDGFLQELLYQSAPHGINPAAPPVRRDFYGEPVGRGSHAAIRLFDISRSAGYDEPQPWDRMAYNWNREHPDDPIAKQEPSNLYTDAETGERERMTPGQYARYKEVAGRRAVVRLRRERFNINRPTEDDRRRFERAVDAARADARQILFRSSAWRNL